MVRAARKVRAVGVVAKLKSAITFGRGHIHWPLRICVTILALYGICIVLYLLGIGFQFIFPASKHIVNLSGLDVLMSRITNPWSVTFCLFALKGFTQDDNHNGLPDGLENENQLQAH